MKIISKETMLDKRRSGTVEQKVIYIAPSGEMRTVTKRIVNGEMEIMELTRPVGEMIVTPAGLENIVQKTVIDLELGRESVPLLYKPIYRPMEDPNFSNPVDVKGFAYATVVFLETMEGETVKMGSYTVGDKAACPIVTYSGGLEWTEDMVEYNQTWAMSEASRSMGEAYNMKLNHIHFAPILEFNYAAKNKTGAVNNPQHDYIVNLRNTIKAGLVHASQDKITGTKSKRNPTILLAHSSKRWDIEECLQRMTINGTIHPAISQISTLIFYDGDSITVGGKTYTYPGVDPDKAYLIDGQKYFRELVKHDLRVDATGADLKKLVANAIVGRSRRGVYAAPANAVEELTLP